MQEIWKDIVGYEGYYQVSNFGRVKSLTRNQVGRGNSILTMIGRILMPCHKSGGYYQVSLYKNTLSKSITIHRLVAKAFIPNPEKKRTVNHINGIKTDNRLENLEWCTNSENTQHAYDLGLINPPIGEQRTLAKLKKIDVLKIRELIMEGVAHKEIANNFNITTSTISDIKTGRSWKHVA